MSTSSPYNKDNNGVPSDWRLRRARIHGEVMEMLHGSGEATKKHNNDNNNNDNKKKKKKKRRSKDDRQHRRHNLRQEMREQGRRQQHPQIKEPDHEEGEGDGTRPLGMGMAAVMRDLDELDELQRGTGIARDGILVHAGERGRVIFSLADLSIGEVYRTTHGSCLVRIDPTTFKLNNFTLHLEPQHPMSSSSLSPPSIHESYHSLLSSSSSSSSPPSSRRSSTSSSFSSSSPSSVPSSYPSAPLPSTAHAESLIQVHAGRSFADGIVFVPRPPASPNTDATTINNNSSNNNNNYNNNNTTDPTSPPLSRTVHHITDLALPLTPEETEILGQEHPTVTWRCVSSPHTLDVTCLDLRRLLFDINGFVVPAEAALSGLDPTVMWPVMPNHEGGGEGMFMVEDERWGGDGDGDGNDGDGNTRIQDSSRSNLTTDDGVEEERKYLKDEDEDEDIDVDQELERWNQRIRRSREQEGAVQKRVRAMLSEMRVDTENDKT